MFTLPKLHYSYDALEPYIDAKTMEIHLHKHHQAYVDNLNKALQEDPGLQAQSLDSILGQLSSLPLAIQSAVRNNGGGHYNHSLFWQMMKKGGSPLKGTLLQAIEKQFSHIDAFKEAFELAAKSRFGSGWAWLVVNADGNLEIVSMPNQDAPVMQNLHPVLGLDVWEHAYYLQYQNRRVDYIQAWWNVVHWDYAQELYVEALKK